MQRAISERIGSIGYLPLAALSSDRGQRLRVLAVRHDGAAHRPGDTGYPIRPRSRGR
ncbi:hypothetical protein D3C83_263140 [compost metagenome]